ncbi:hypothetical protein F383_23025 [Gossypium arboreum]|uniref:Uncharacterized protein n=1 Tax=Gossypium arboreum TaxID=29729 RepID=A0A0B0NR73_GOSAR|nr:hypothetical protein F383_23025 [Gossypium arboreum]
MLIITTTKIKEIGNKYQIRCFLVARLVCSVLPFSVVLVDQGCYEHLTAAPNG